MPRWLKIVLVVGASGALFFGIVIGGFAWWFRANRAELRERGKAAEAEGKQYGLGKSSNACIDESLARVASTRGIMQQALLGVFMRGCLEGAPRDPALCVGVPATSEMMKSATWRNETCAARGKRGDQACFELVGTIQEVCHPSP
jgi:hypothetical protein